MKVKLVEMTTEDFLNESSDEVLNEKSKVKFEGSKTELSRGAKGTKGIIKRLVKDNPGKPVAFNVSELSQEQVKELKKKISRKQIGNFLAASVIGLGLEVAARKTAGKALKNTPRDVTPGAMNKLKNPSQQTLKKVAVGAAVGAGAANLKANTGAVKDIAKNVPESFNQWFLVKFNLKDKNGADSILVRAKNKNVVASTIKQVIAKIKKG